MGYRRAPHLAWREVAGEVIVVNLASKRMYGLNPTGGLVWQAMEEKRSRDLDTLLEETFPDSSTRPWAAAFLQRFLDDLQAAGLVEAEQETERRPAPDDVTWPLADQTPPAVVWSEEMRRAVGQCAFFPSEGEPCYSFPELS